MTSSDDDHESDDSNEDLPFDCRYEPLLLENLSDSRSIVESYGQGSHTCGYCKSDQDSRVSHDLKAIQLRVDVYQSLLERYWRRSGHYCYRPLNQSMCCPNYAIICLASKFCISRSQRMCLARMNSFIQFGDTNNVHKIKYEACQTESFLKKIIIDKLINLEEFENLKSSSKLRPKRFVRKCEQKSKQLNIDLEEAIKLVVDSNVRRYNEPQYTLEDLIHPKKVSLSNFGPAKHRLELKLHISPSKQSYDLRQEKLNLMQKYQLAVHKEDQSQWSTRRYTDFLEFSPLIHEKIMDLSFGSNYVISEDGFVANYIDQEDQYLVKPPPLPTYYGTYHCLYMLDDKLIAIGVLDILPKCITTVYFFYDPDYSFLNLGIYSALVEISMVREMTKRLRRNNSEQVLDHYHLGYFVPRCKKMSYKSKFKPSYLLCNETYEYVEIDRCLRMLKEKRYVRFSNKPQSHGSEKITLERLFRVKLITPDQRDTTAREYISWMRNKLDDRDFDRMVYYIFVQYINLMGDDLVSKVHLKLTGIHRYILNIQRSQ